MLGEGGRGMGARMSGTTKISFSARIESAPERKRTQRDPTIPSHPPSRSCQRNAWPEVSVAARS